MLSPEEMEVRSIFDPLWDDIDGEDLVHIKKPLLAHYTSLANLEKIMTTDELWFSNPLLMNDLEELRFGMHQGADLFENSGELKRACVTEDRFHHLVSSFHAKFFTFSAFDAVDTYVFCFSEHVKNDTDGLLSMWRGYGRNGNGAAIIFDSSKLNYQNDSPLIFSRVNYASSDERRKWLYDKISQFARLLETGRVSDERLDLAVSLFFERLKVFSLFSKHHGFKEEKEWRAVYMPSRDYKRQMKGMLSYIVSDSSVEPKLKLKVAPIKGLFAEDISMEKLVHQILLGPSLSNHLSVSTTKRMVEQLGKKELAQKVVASSTPFRLV